jgi:hypothetical protein
MYRRHVRYLVKACQVVSRDVSIYPHPCASCGRERDGTTTYRQVIMTTLGQLDMDT